MWDWYAGIMIGGIYIGRFWLGIASSLVLQSSPHIRELSSTADGHRGSRYRCCCRWKLVAQESWRHDWYVEWDVREILVAEIVMLSCCTGFKWGGMQIMYNRGLFVVIVWSLSADNITQSWILSCALSPEASDNSQYNWIIADAIG